MLREVCRAWEEDRQWQDSQQRARESMHSSLGSTLVEGFSADDNEEEEEEDETDGAAAVAQALQQELEESGYLSSVRGARATP